MTKRFRLTQSIMTFLNDKYIQFENLSINQTYSIRSSIDPSKYFQVIIFTNGNVECCCLDGIRGIKCEHYHKALELYQLREEYIINFFTKLSKMLRIVRQEILSKYYTRKLNEYITVKLDGYNTTIYVKGKEFNQCKYLMMEISSKKDWRSQQEISSIDEAINTLNPPHQTPNITPEQEFWGHCSNLQAWVECNYDTRILHSNLSFPLLRELVRVGDPIAKKVYKDEIFSRIEIGYVPTTQFIIQEYVKDLTLEEKLCLVELINEKYPNHEAEIGNNDKIILRRINNSNKIVATEEDFLFEIDDFDFELEEFIEDVDENELINQELVDEFDYKQAIIDLKSSFQKVNNIFLEIIYSAIALTTSYKVETNKRAFYKGRETKGYKQYKKFQDSRESRKEYFWRMRYKDYEWKPATYNGNETENYKAWKTQMEIKEWNIANPDKKLGW